MVVAISMQSKTLLDAVTIAVEVSFANPWAQYLAHSDGWLLFDRLMLCQLSDPRLSDKML